MQQRLGEVLRSRKEQEVTCTGQKGMTSWGSAPGVGTRVLRTDDTRTRQDNSDSLKQWEMALVCDKKDGWREKGKDQEGNSQWALAVLLKLKD